MNSRPITIVGCGQAGSSIAYHCLQRGYPVRILDARAEPSVKQNQQIPWGWYRKISLQSSLKRRLTTPDFPFPEWTGHINQTNGPMLITTKNDSVVHQWKRWCEECEGTDARIVTPANAEQEFHLSADYFAHHGGVFVCDSRDYLIDFNALNTQLWEYFDAHPDCEWVKGCRVGRVTTHPESGTHSLRWATNPPPSSPNSQLFKSVCLMRLCINLQTTSIFHCGTKIAVCCFTTMAQPKWRVAYRAHLS